MSHQHSWIFDLTLHRIRRGKLILHPFQFRLHERKIYQKFSTFSKSYPFITSLNTAYYIPLHFMPFTWKTWLQFCANRRKKMDDIKRKSIFSASPFLYLYFICCKQNKLELDYLSFPHAYIAREKVDKNQTILILLWSHLHVHQSLQLSMYVHLISFSLCFKVKHCRVQRMKTTQKQICFLSWLLIWLSSLSSLRESPSVVVYFGIPGFPVPRILLKW